MIRFSDKLQTDPVVKITTAVYPGPGQPDSIMIYADAGSGPDSIIRINADGTYTLRPIENPEVAAAFGRGRGQTLKQRGE
jgi:hypothetical protein